MSDAAPSFLNLRLALAGALAGMFTNTVLHPLDTVKTLRQTSPNTYRGLAPAIVTIVQAGGPAALYAGIAPALFGSAISSSLYFGVYELAKRQIRPERRGRFRAPATAISAACGNVASSIMFVPKEVVKQRMQAGLHQGSFWGAAAAVVKSGGMKGLYRGYRATLMRNIPSAMLRFTIYEELKVLIGGGKQLTPGGYVMAGAIAGGVASACTTPLDVIKTRFATGGIEPGTGVLRALGGVVRNEGVGGLFVGVKPRVVWAALFAAIGFTSYEVCKAWALGRGTSRHTCGRRRRRRSAEIRFA